MTTSSTDQDVTALSNGEGVIFDEKNRSHENKGHIVNGSPECKRGEDMFPVKSTIHKLCNDDKKNSQWISLIPTKSRDEVPLLFQEPYVNHGFRALHQPWFYYICSTLQMHNEVVNVWTHVLAFTLTTVRLATFSKDVDFLNDPYSWPLLAGMLCGVALYACSSGAHCLQSRSEFVHYVAFMVDYAGIGLYGLGSILLHLMYCSEPEFYDAVHQFYVPLGCFLGFMISCCHTIAKVIYDRPYPPIRKAWQILPIIVLYAVLIAPIIDRVFECYVYGTDCNQSIPYHIRQIFFFFLSGFFFASDFPQRLCPGKCDYFFHSHQCFHVAIMLCTLNQSEAVFIDFVTRADVIRNRVKPTFISSFGPVLFVLLCEVACITFFARKCHLKLKDRNSCPEIKQKKI